jgi:hypothetical protein
MDANGSDFVRDTQYEAQRMIVRTADVTLDPTWNDE